MSGTSPSYQMLRVKRAAASAATDRAAKIGASHPRGAKISWLAARIGCKARPIRPSGQSPPPVCDTGGHDTEFPDNSHLSDTVLGWLGEETRRKALVTKPQGLFGFPPI